MNRFGISDGTFIRLSGIIAVHIGEKRRNDLKPLCDLNISYLVCF